VYKIFYEFITFSAFQQKNETTKEANKFMRQLGNLSRRRLRPIRSGQDRFVASLTRLFTSDLLNDGTIVVSQPKCSGTNQDAFSPKRFRLSHGYQERIVAGKQLMFAGVCIELSKHGVAG